MDGVSSLSVALLYGFSVSVDVEAGVVVPRLVLAAWSAAKKSVVGAYSSIRLSLFPLMSSFMIVLIEMSVSF